MKTLNLVVLSLGVTLSTAVTGGCQTPNYQRNGTVLGGLSGAGLGAAIGNKSGHALPGALIGAGIGAVTGNAVGESMDRDRAVAQQQAYAQGLGTQAARGTVTPQEVIEMTRAGLSEQVIANHVRTHGVSHTLGANDLIYLRNNGVPDSVMQAMQSAPSSQTRYNSAYTAALPPPPAPTPVVVEHVYPAPAYCPPPYYYWRGHYHHHGHHHHHHRPGHIHWGFSFGH